MRALVLLALIGGCIRDHNVICGELACPVGSVCTANGCADPAQVAACDGAEDDAACEASGFAAGVCQDGVCLEVLCGDGVALGDEECDDGNQRSGDGCSADCLSREVCGNGYVDSLALEQCDDGALGLSGDGCTATCSIEVPSWRDVTSRAPVGRSGPVGTFDTARNRFVIFGGSRGDSMLPTADILEWDEGIWRVFPAPTELAPRTGASIAYDAERKLTVLFGGLVGNAATNETWVWSGRQWTKLIPATSPPKRSNAAMAYDPVRKRVLLFGGTSDYINYLSDTWSWDGTTWTQETTAVAPSTEFADMTWDEARGSMLLVNDARETWRWNGSAWTLLPAQAPSVANITLARDGNFVLLYGGTTAETYRWNGTAWSALSSTSAPQGRYGFAMTYWPASNRVLVFGGRSRTCIGSCVIYNDVWEWTGSNWVFDNGATVTPIPTNPKLAYLPSHGETIHFGGFPPLGLSPSNQTFAWDGHAWKYRSTVVAPPGRYGQLMVTANDRVLMFGGYEYGPLDDLWSYDGTTWREETATTKPPARNVPYGAFDRARNRLVVFGGVNSSGKEIRDVWEWDGASWQDRTPATLPPARRGAAVAYDAKRERTVMFGGNVGQDLLADTWEWDGTTWTERTPTVSPPARFESTLAYDALRGTMILFGGASTGSLNDTWEWNGFVWRKLDVPSAPSARNGHGMVFDARLGQLHVFGGNDPTSWALETSSATTPRDVCREVDTDGDSLVGCADPDCWGYCTPSCPPHLSCDPNAPRCGDGTCSPVEDALICPSDC